MFVVWVGSLYTTALFVTEAGDASRQENVFAGLVAAWLWFTVLFANLAEAVAEGRGKAQADTELQRFYHDVLPPDLSAARRITFLPIAIVLEVILLILFTPALSIVLRPRQRDAAIEMAAIADACAVDVPADGLLFPPCGGDDLPHVCRPVVDGGVLASLRTQ